MYDNHNVEIYIAVLDDILTNDICNKPAPMAERSNAYSRVHSL